jgi:hypothetical protein
MSGEKQYSAEAIGIHQSTPLTLDEAEEIAQRYRGIPCLDQIVRVGLMTGYWPDPKDLKETLN